ncbi:hypothetical protein HanRHA438_Chr14g0665991 [Helianthus annuus]|uniref:Uncharacterized protein n=1 Tax=Helianthus annuus TaxID=4232 RepID=A0A251SJD8_HELAN|nr:hypothetical protein HanXRQr2_Chr14g0655131 [Helianthus annuus]KAJ0464995.1 hypothetical protein HanHA300_Chr14g0533501 [Helianthus annuus]KAJ0486588.1 hypothetical protein HanHA89_Chr14g0581321 [Helianthus annuus]KAJ0657154.1 hypothetical protein HanLR1_Chr14g0543901 [Helianthus annuus]KAJ0660731.1 hypothetical protein HanOQP8_Chr14g0541001 [Helianthus annuus]
MVLFPFNLTAKASSTFCLYKTTFFCLCILILSAQYTCYSDKEGNPVFPLMPPIAYSEKRGRENQRTQREKEMCERPLTGVKAMSLQSSRVSTEGFNSICILQ